MERLPRNDVVGLQRPTINSTGSGSPRYVITGRATLTSEVSPPRQLPQMTTPTNSWTWLLRR